MPELIRRPRNLTSRSGTRYTWNSTTGQYQDDSGNSILWSVLWMTLSGEDQSFYPRDERNFAPDTNDLAPSHGEGLAGNNGEGD